MKGEAEVEQIENRLFVFSYAKTVDGLSVADPPISVSSSISDAELGMHVRHRLSAFRLGIPRPTHDQLHEADKEALRLRGLRSRRDFEALVAKVGIDQDGNAFRVYPYRRMERSGHGSVDELAVVITSPAYLVGGLQERPLDRRRPRVDTTRPVVPAT